MSNDKKRMRANFREAVFARDNNKCRVCGWNLFVNGLVLDAHHITDRNLVPNGGYVKENGISLCPGCHEKAEVFHSTGVVVQGFAPADLYSLVGSSHEKAVKESEDLV